MNGAVHPNPTASLVVMMLVMTHLYPIMATHGADPRQTRGNPDGTPVESGLQGQAKKCILTGDPPTCCPYKTITAAHRNLQTSPEGGDIPNKVDHVLHLAYFRTPAENPNALRQILPPVAMVARKKSLNFLAVLEENRLAEN